MDLGLPCASTCLIINAAMPLTVEESSFHDPMQVRWRSSADGWYTPSSTGRSAMKRLCAVLVMLLVWVALFSSAIAVAAGSVEANVIRCEIATKFYCEA